MDPSAIAGFDNSGMAQGQNMGMPDMNAAGMNGGYGMGKGQDMGGYGMGGRGDGGKKGGKGKKGRGKGKGKKGKTDIFRAGNDGDRLVPKLSEAEAKEAR